MISVVIPTYNHRDYILATLESVFSQTYTDFELIIVNDGSPDDTDGLLQPLIRAGKITTYLTQENRGQASARNTGLSAARGEYIAFLDDDDLWPSDKLEWQVAALRRNPSTAMVYGDRKLLRPDGSLAEGTREEGPAGWVRKEFSRRNWIESPGQVLIRTEALRKIGGFDPSLWGTDDWDVYIRLADVGEFSYCPRVALLYRVHEGNASRHAVRHARNHWKVVRKHFTWNIPLVLANQRLASYYFVPNLLRSAEDSWRAGKGWEAAKAYLYTIAFDPTLPFRPWFIHSLVRTLGKKD